MHDLRQTELRNKLLRALSDTAFNSIAPHLLNIALRRGERIASAFKHLERVYFVERGVFSVIAVTAEGAQTEVGMIGREGFVGLSAVLDGRVSPFDMLIQGEGEALTMPSVMLAELSERQPALRAVLLDYVQVFLIQVSHTAVANSALSLRNRLARWLLMMHDRVDGDQMTVTHEFLSLMLAVRRPGVTEAVQSLEATGAIKARRGLIDVRDREKLRELAGSAYLAPADGIHQPTAAT